MAGEATWLNAAAAATPTPVTAANTALPPTVATARRPGTPRSLWLTMLNRSLAAPQCAMSMPITVKQGMTTKLYSLMPDSADCCSRLIIGSRPPSAKYRPSAAAAANAKTMGTPTTMRTSSAMRPLHISNGMFRLLPILLRPLFFRGAHRSTFAFGCGMGASGRPCGADAATRALGDKADAHQRGHHPQHDGAESQRPGGDAHGVVAEEFAAAPACERWLPGDEHHRAEERGAPPRGGGAGETTHPPPHTPPAPGQRVRRCPGRACRTAGGPLRRSKSPASGCPARWPPPHAAPAGFDRPRFSSNVLFQLQVFKAAVLALRRAASRADMPAPTARSAAALSRRTGGVWRRPRWRSLGAAQNG